MSPYIFVLPTTAMLLLHQFSLLALWAQTDNGEALISRASSTAVVHFSAQ